MSRPRGRIMIIGGSMAGLFAGVLLRRAGWQVDIYERSGAALASRGAGITTHDELYAAFRQAGIEIEQKLAIESRERLLLDARGEIIGRRTMAQMMTSWGLLYRFLRARFPDQHYHGGHTFSDLKQDQDGVTASFNADPDERADFLIAADGMRSAVRSIVMPEATVEYAGYTAWRGLAAERDLSATMRAEAAGRFLLCLPPGEHVLGYMVAGPGDTISVGQRSYNWVWYRPAAADQRLPALLTGSDGRHYAEGIPHHLIQPHFSAAMRADATQLLPPALCEAVHRTAQPFLQPIQQLASKRLVAGRVIVIGDAAFTARPHVGLGVSKAADDAARLAQVFDLHDGALVAGLRQWEFERLRFGRAAVSHSADLGCYLDGQDSSDPDELKRRAFFRSPAVVLARIAARDPYQYLNL